MKFGILVLSLCLCLKLFSISPAELRTLSTKVSNEFHFNEALADFPHENYEIYEVPGLGYFYIDDIPDNIKLQLKRGIYWEKGIGDYVRKYTRPGTIAIDLGAHIGIHSLTMSKCVGQDGLVIAFEPQIKIFCELCNNLNLNNCMHNVIPLPMACGEVAKTIEMTAPNTVNEGGTPIGRGGNRTKMITLDSLKLSNVSFIKMDVESYELNVLKGAKKTILKNRPIIVFEILGGVDLTTCRGTEQQTMQQIFDLLESLDYTVELIYGNDFLAYPNKP